MEMIAAGSMLLWSPINTTQGSLSANQKLVFSFSFLNWFVFSLECGNFTITSHGMQNTLPNKYAI